MIIQAFIRWAETAKASDRARAASALARAWRESDMEKADREAAVVAMTWLLDDPSPKVRLALADALADCAEAPRHIVLTLAEDQPEVANHMLSRSPVLSDVDLVELAARGDGVTRSIIAMRFFVAPSVAAAIAEVGESIEIENLLDNPGAVVTPSSLERIAERLGDISEIRERLMSRPELPARGRLLLTRFVAGQMGDCGFLRAVLGERRLARISAESVERAAIELAGGADERDLSRFMEGLRQQGVLTASLLMQALCARRIEFFRAAICDLSGLPERRIRAVLETGTAPALSMLLEKSGLSTTIIPVFVESVMAWRAEIARPEFENSLEGWASRIVSRFREGRKAPALADQLLDLVERFDIAERRQIARTYASHVAIAAA